MVRLLSLCLAVALMAAGLACEAQESQVVAVAPQQETKTQGPRGTVSGTVYCADTNLPARVAGVSLFPLSGSPQNGAKTATTDLDGHFTLTKVPEGLYYISAQLAGYLNPLANLTHDRLAAMTPEARKEFEAHVSTVTVSAKNPAEVALRLERAAEIDGTVLFDDGSPATGLRVDLTPKSNKPAGPDLDAPFFGLTAFDESSQHSTDDHGHFRILGVAPGEYLVHVMVPTVTSDRSEGDLLAKLLQSSPLGGLTVYSGESLRSSKAKVIKVGAGDTARDADIMIPLGKLHSIRGQVTLKGTGQPALAATVQLLYADTREFARLTTASDGEFEFTFIPEGSFILAATALPEPLPKLPSDEDEEDVGLGFIAGGHEIMIGGKGAVEGGAEVPLQVTGNMSGVSIAVPDPASKKPETPSETGDHAPEPTSPPQ